MEDNEHSYQELVYRKMTYELTDSTAERVCHSVGQYSVCLCYFKTRNQLTPFSSCAEIPGESVAQQENMLTK